MLNFFKPLFPSWKFFDESVDTPVLLYRLVTDSEWKIVVPHPKRNWWNLFFNPEGNLYLAYHSHMQQLMGDLTDFEEEKIAEFSSHISYRITENFVRAKHPERDFQFKVSAIKLHDDETFSVLEDILISPILQVNA